MPTQIYETATVETVYGDKVYVTPLKIKYLKQFMEEFDNIKNTRNDSESMEVLAQCCLVAMQQYKPDIKTLEDLEDSFDLETIYTIIDVGAGIKMKQVTPDAPQKESSKKSDGQSWNDLDLVKLESEAFLLGIWKDYEELESSLCMQELSAILEAKREADYQDKKFFAAIQGVDLDAQNGSKNEWEEMKARVAAKVSGIENKGANDITSFVGQRAQKSGFGIGMGLDYEKI